MATTLSAAEVVERGKALYEQSLRPQVEEGNLGNYLVVDVMTGEYEIGPDHLEAAQRARAKRPEAALYGMRIGYPATAAIGTRLRPLKEKGA